VYCAIEAKQPTSKQLIERDGSCGKWGTADLGVEFSIQEHVVRLEVTVNNRQRECRCCMDPSSDVDSDAQSDVPLDCSRDVVEHGAQRATSEQLGHHKRAAVSRSASAVKDEKVGVLDHLQRFTLFAQLLCRLGVHACHGRRVRGILVDRSGRGFLQKLDGHLHVRVQPCPHLTVRALGEPCVECDVLPRDLPRCEHPLHAKSKRLVLFMSPTEFERVKLFCSATLCLECDPLLSTVPKVMCVCVCGVWCVCVRACVRACVCVCVGD
jgi:hypothetical protein